MNVFVIGNINVLAYISKIQFSHEASSILNWEGITIVIELEPGVSKDWYWETTNV